MPHWDKWNSDEIHRIFGFFVRGPIDSVQVSDFHEYPPFHT
jgi:hypothetical protein